LSSQSVPIYRDFRSSCEDFLKSSFYSSGEIEHQPIAENIVKS